MLQTTSGKAGLRPQLLLASGPWPPRADPCRVSWPDPGNVVSAGPRGCFSRSGSPGSLRRPSPPPQRTSRGRAAWQPAGAFERGESGARYLPWRSNAAEWVRHASRDGYPIGFNHVWVHLKAFVRHYRRERTGDSEAGAKGDPPAGNAGRRWQHDQGCDERAFRSSSAGRTRLWSAG